MFISNETMSGLTGYKRFKQQRGWLDSNGWVYETDCHGRPKVAVEYWRWKMGIVEQKPKRWEPDFSCLNT